MQISLAGKKALVTGGTRGIGRELTRALATAGADVVACYRQPGEHVEELARELKRLPGDHELVRADVSDPADVDALIAACRTRLGSLDVVVHNAGVISHQPFESLPIEDWERVLRVNLTGSFRVIQASLGLLGAGASIINIGSRAATVGIPLRAHYTASKAGLIGLTRSLAKELGPKGIRVNLVAPGVITTEHPLPDQIRQRYEELTALRRLGNPSDVATVVCFLASDLAGYVTGETIHVDGGI